MRETVLVLDFGAQYTQLIARRVRELGVYSEIQPFHYPVEAIRKRRPSAIILSGGPSSVWMSHGDALKSPPPGFEPIAHSDNSPICAIRDSGRKIFGVQFHPEVV